MSITMLLFSCKSSQQNTSAVNSKSPKESVKKPVTDPDFSPEEKNTRMNILDASIDQQKTLHLIISYSGGCKEHEFNIYTSGHYIKTLPPKMNIWLVNEQNEDACRQLITDTLAFDLSGLIMKDYDKILFILNDDSRQTIEFQRK
jgi:hypothetical protein